MTLLIFAGAEFHPKGGAHDLVDETDSYENALRKVANMSSIDWWQIVRSDETGFTILDEGKRK
jgi:hypothetical protein